MLLHVLDDGAVITPAEVWHQWHAEPVALALVVASAVVYARGARALRRRGAVHAVTRSREVAYYSGLATLWIALGSPVDALADTLFAAHMLQHVLLIAVAAPLVAAGAPLVPLLWGLPYGARRWIGRMWNRGGLGPAAGALTGAATATLLHILALWGWHLPALYTAALRNEVVHAIEHLCFFTTALLVWWIALRPFHRRHAHSAAAIVVTAIAAVQSAALGALLTFSGTLWYTAQSAGAAAWGLTPLEDQQLAGLIMWIPPGFVYLAVILAVLARRLHDAGDLSTGSTGAGAPDVDHADEGEGAPRLVPSLRALH